MGIKTTESRCDNGNKERGEGEEKGEKEKQLIPT
jgi:hypothetical protein